MLGDLLFCKLQSNDALPLLVDMHVNEAHARPIGWNFQVLQYIQEIISNSVRNMGKYSIGITFFLKVSEFSWH